MCCDYVLYPNNATNSGLIFDDGVIGAPCVPQNNPRIFVTVGSESLDSLRQPEASLQEACVLSRHWKEPDMVTPACHPKHLAVRGWKTVFTGC